MAERSNQNPTTGRTSDQNPTIGGTESANWWDFPPEPSYLNPVTGETVSDQAALSPEHFYLNQTLEEISAVIPTIGETVSHQNPPMAQPSDQNPPIGETSNWNTEIGQSSNKEPSYDFLFAMKPVKVLKHALESLSDPNFNTRQEAVIEVGPGGCKIEVHTYNTRTGVEGFGYLGLKASGLERFQCRNSLSKAFRMKGVKRIFKSAVKFFEGDSDSVLLFVVEGSNKLSFRFGEEDFGYGSPISVDLKNVHPAIERFPDSITYGFEAVIPSSLQRRMSETLQQQPTPRPQLVEVTLQPASIEVGVCSVGITNSMEEQVQEHRVSTEWQYWKALESASNTAPEASVYLVTAPGNGIMERFHLEELGDLVYQHPATFDSVSALPFLGIFRSLD